MVGTTAALIAMGVAAAASAGSQAVQANQSRIAGERLGTKQREGEDALIQSQKDQATAVTDQQGQIAQTAQNTRQRQLGMSQTPDMGGMGGTILTSPLGIPGGNNSAVGGGKTLLGA